ncbi:DUF2190 family protein [Falsiroseomonas tokyonensis]|uniref:DUF2190 family protein n=1 Tax=Falsiroseomonas tokyonensis TaxID=430521 RepID=A0ABV7BYR4_9PROT|nr:DUF2190 family protein [Falsiroseomonas tokyonensis]
MHYFTQPPMPGLGCCVWAPATPTITGDLIPMRNYVQPGDSLALAVPYAGGVTSGQGVLVGALFGVAAVDGVQNAVIECQTKGVFDITKEPALAITAGARVFWDNTNRRLTTTATGNFQVGLATVAALAADTTVRAVLLRVPALGT